MSRLALWGGSAASALLVVVALVLSGSGVTGTDDQAVNAIATLAPAYRPWFTLPWHPGSSEVESFLFAFQAALGAGVFGYVVGLRHGRAQGRRELPSTLTGGDDAAG